jgi:hypothetical protein
MGSHYFEFFLCVCDSSPHVHVKKSEAQNVMYVHLIDVFSRKCALHSPSFVLLSGMYNNTVPVLVVVVFTRCRPRSAAGIVQDIGRRCFSSTLRRVHDTQVEGIL